MNETPIIPDYAAANLAGIIPALLGPSTWRGELPDWMPDSVERASQICLLVLDGIGWDQLEQRRDIAPTLASFCGGRITSVAPTTTATALTSIATGLTPGEHGLVGYRMLLGGEIMNVLRWTAADGDRARQHPPETTQRAPAFMGEKVGVISPAELAGTSFTTAHLRGTEHIGYRSSSSLPIEIAHTLERGDRFVYAYYGGVDKIAHERGFGVFYDAELAAADSLVAQICDRLPPGAVLIVTADHGQVEVGDRIVYPNDDVLKRSSMLSGEGRFRWFHARHSVSDLYDACVDQFASTGWVFTRDEIVDLGVFGPHVSPQVQRRLGDVAVLAREEVSYYDPLDSGPFELVCRHGSLTSQEVYVPLLASEPAT